MTQARFKFSYLEENSSEAPLEWWRTLVKTIQKLAYISLLTAFLILLHQYIVYGVWFETGDVHHETFSIAFFSLSLGILLGFVGRTRKT